MELALLYQSRQVRCCPVREADFVEVETRTETQYDPEVEPACVSERDGTRQGFECWLERLAEYADRVSLDFDANPAAAVQIVCCFVVNLLARSHEDGGGFGQVSAGFFNVSSYSSRVSINFGPAGELTCTCDIRCSCFCRRIATTSAYFPTNLFRRRGGGMNRCAFEFPLVEREDQVGFPCLACDGTSLDYCSVKL